MPYEVKLEKFEGPLDLLLYLVNRNEVSILDIPISLITDQYLETLERVQSVNLEIAGEYLVMASYLTQIKSACLLPSVHTDDQEETVEDPRQELIEHLLEYKRYRDVSRMLDCSPILGREVFSRGFFDEDVERLDSVSNIKVSMDDLLEVLNELVARTARPDLLVLEPEALAVKDKINLIIDVINRKKWVTFRSLFDDDMTKIQMITTFLALLEVVKMGLARIYQDTPFGAILISKQ
ncbi:MAG: segregation/condensation protein A [Syntrophaceae bacterium]|nr:segregation/condensation protein A [Syntrophaceae bacterium]